MQLIFSTDKLIVLAINLSTNMFLNSRILKYGFMSSGAHWSTQINFLITIVLVLARARPQGTKSGCQFCALVVLSELNKPLRIFPNAWGSLKQRGEAFRSHNKDIGHDSQQFKFLVNRRSIEAAHKFPILGYVTLQSQTSTRIKCKLLPMIKQPFVQPIPQFSQESLFVKTF